MNKKISIIVFIIILIHLSCVSQNITFQDLLGIQRKNFTQANAVISIKAGWKYFNNGINSEFYDYYYNNWSYKLNIDTYEAESWLMLCEKEGFENAVIFTTSLENYNEIKKNVINDGHWKLTGSYQDEYGTERTIYTWTKYNFEFVAFNDYQVILYNSQEILPQKLKRQKIADSLTAVAKVAEEKMLKEKAKQDSIAAVEKAIQDSIAAAIEEANKKEIQSKTYDLINFGSIYNKIKECAVNEISEYLKSVASGQRIETICRFSVRVSIEKKIKVIPLDNQIYKFPAHLYKDIEKCSIIKIYEFPLFQNYPVQAEGVYEIPVSYEIGSIKLYKKRNGNINYHRSEPSEVMKGEIARKLYIQGKGVYFLEYTERKIDGKQTNNIVQTGYKKTTGFRTFMSIFGSIVGLGSLATLSILIGAPVQ